MDGEILLPMQGNIFCWISIFGKENRRCYVTDILFVLLTNAKKLCIYMEMTYSTR